MKRFLLLVLTAAAVWLPAAHAAVPCRDQIYNEWYASGKISTKYPAACYRDALKHIPADAQVYSNLGSDIKRALQLSLERSTSVNPSRIPSAVGSGHLLPTNAETKGVVKTRIQHAPGPSTVAVGETSGNSSGLPTPVLILGGVALALAAAGLVGSGVRYVRRRG
ncbi:MAG TPA: hypothetical protein VFW85_05770 [Gaiellaceae bacterium]|nr:hypothetical protein [Gaiellaceae bacterium]